MKRISIFLILSVGILVSCKKEIKPDNIFLEQFFEQNVLNRDFKITYAYNMDVEITDQYAGYVIRLLKADYYHGPLKMTKGSEVYEGTWKCNEDYGKLTISLPASPPEFQFLSREWRFTSKQLPELKLAPWGSQDSIAVNLLRQ